MPQATALEGLSIGEVSGVDHPAHLEEGWLVMKNAGVAQDALDQVEIVETLVDAVEKAAGIAPELLAAVGAEVLDTSARETLAHLLPTAQVAKEATSMPFDPSTLDTEAAEYVKSLTERLEAAESAVVKSADADPDAEALAKALDGLPEPIRKHLADQAQALEIATTVAKAEQNLRLDAEYLAKAKSFENLTIEPSDLAKVLRKVAETDPAAAADLDKVLKAASEQVDTAALFASAGAPAVPQSGSATSRVDALAKAIVADEADPVTDYTEAVTKALSTDPSLYAEYRRESSAPQEG